MYLVSSNSLYYNHRMNNDQNVVENDKPAEVKKDGDSFWDLVKFGILALLIVIPIRLFVAQPFIVSGTSMVPTFHDSEYLIVDELSYRLHHPKRGDVVIFRAPTDTSKFFIKRVIALPTETIEIKGSEVFITNATHPEGTKLAEPYVEHPAYNDLKVTLKEGEYFVMGDNRIASSDSRSWGTLPEKNLIGRAFLRLFPVSQAAVLPGNHPSQI